MTAMAAGSDKDILARLADAGEDALRRLGEAPGMDRAMAYARTTRKQLDELTKRVQGISALEARIAKLEKQVAALSKETSTASGRRRARRRRLRRREQVARARRGAAAPLSEAR